MKPVMLFIFLVVITGHSASASNMPRINELRSLRDSLSLQDPKRAVLEWKLGLALMNEVGQSSHSSKAAETSLKYSALNIFVALLRGDTFHQGLDGEKRYIALLNSGILYLDLGQAKKGLESLEEVINQREYPRLHLQAAGRVAEYFDKNKFRKKAHQYYRIALQSCRGEEICAYLNYKDGWVFFRENDFANALQRMRKAVFGQEGQVREEALRDLLVFHASAGIPLEASISELDTLSEKTRHPELLEAFSETLVKHGKLADSTETLEYAQKRRPTLSKRVRLLSNYFSLRNWNEFKLKLGELSMPAEPVRPEDADMIRRTLKNLAVQLDGERKGDNTHSPELKTLLEAYLTLFPKSEDRFQMMEGWLAAETDSSRKLETLNQWVKTDLLPPDSSKFAQFHEIRALLASEQNEPETALDSLERILLGEIPEAKKRPLTFMKAEMLSALNRGEEALPLYLSIAKFETQPDELAWKSQKALLDAYTHAKSYGKVVDQAQSWLNRRKTSPFHPPMVDGQWDALARIHREAQFQWALEQGHSEAALRVFMDRCQKRELMPQSCQNAGEVARTLGDVRTFLTAREIIADPKELAADYELAAQFGKAAEQFERNWEHHFNVERLLKVALLYELASRPSDQQRLLRSLKPALKGTRFGRMEDLILVSLRDAKLVDASLLQLNWSELNQARIAAILVESGSTHAQYRRMVLDAGPEVGGLWHKLVEARLEELASVQRKIDFHGKDSADRFRQRSRHLEKLVSEAETYSDQADEEMQRKISSLVADLYRDFASKIRQTPMPKGLSPSKQQEVEERLTEMAFPLEKKAHEYATLSLRPGLQKVASASPVSAPTPSKIRLQIDKLSEKPWDRRILEETKQFFEREGCTRISAYFEGRLDEIAREGDL